MLITDWEANVAIIMILKIHEIKSARCFQEMLSGKRKLFSSDFGTMTHNIL